MRLLMIDAEQEAEAAFIRSRPEAAFHQAAYLAGCKARRLNILTEIDLILAEESGARDALAEAEVVPAPGVGIGEERHLRSDDLVAQALVLDDALVHASVFARVG